MTDTFTPLPIKYGSFSNRMIASSLDLGVLLMVALPVVDFIMDKLFAPADMSGFLAILSAPNATANLPQLISGMWDITLKQHLMDRIVLENALQVVFIALYILPFWFYFSTTPGKWLFRLRIQDARTGLPMSRRQSVVRFLSYAISFLPFSFGFLWIGLNKKRQGFHDLLAGTVVIVKPKAPSAL